MDKGEEDNHTPGYYCRVYEGRIDPNDHNINIDRAIGNFDPLYYQDCNKKAEPT